MKIKHVDHIGIVVNDLETATEFFLGLGFTLAGEMTVEGEWVGRVIGLKDVHSDMAMLKAPDGKVSIELSKFHNPEAIGSGQPTASNVLGLRHLAFQVEDLDSTLAELDQKGYKLIGEAVTYKNSWKTSYVSGPEGIIIELAEQLS